MVNIKGAEAKALATMVLAMLNRDDSVAAHLKSAESLLLWQH